MKHKIAVTILVILTIVTVLFIWNNSRKVTDASHSDSAAVAEAVENIVTQNGKKEAGTGWQSILSNIRKAAHAIEFFVFGIEITVLTFIIRKRFTPQELWNILSVSLAIAVVDESIQILSGRGARVQDVLLDFCGATVGFLLTLLIQFIISSCKKKKYKRT